MSFAVPLLAGCAATSSVSPISATSTGTLISGPVTGGVRGKPYSTSVVDLAPYGYTESEYFVSGKAHAYRPAEGTGLGDDGRWQVVAGDEVPYKTRILVRRPPAAKFNGTVIVEFMQEYFGTERDANYRWNAETYLREGYAWVGVSLHHEGIDDPTPQQTFEYNGNAIKTGLTMARWDPERYGSLSVPSSDLSFYFLTDVGRALKSRGAAGVDPFSGLKIKEILAAGHSIASQRLGIYINAVHPIERVFDGFYLQDFTPTKQVGLAKGLSTPTGVLRADTMTPVLVFQTMTAATSTGPSPETPYIRFWAPSGSSHTTGAYMARVAISNERELGLKGDGCPVEFANTMPQQLISGAAVVALDKWVRTGKAPKSRPQVAKYAGPADPVAEPASYFDAQGNVAGGLRSPWVDVPTVRYDWRGPCLGGAGRSFPFDRSQLAALYGTPANYHARFAAAARKAVSEGTLLSADAEKAIREAEKVSW